MPAGALPQPMTRLPPAGGGAEPCPYFLLAKPEGSQVEEDGLYGLRLRAYLPEAGAPAQAWRHGALRMAAGTRAA